MYYSYNNPIKKALKKIGIDKAIAYSSGARIIQALTGVGSIFFITTFLTGVEQGFYYTFGSILALQVFFELGFTGIMTQYVAHEASHLQIGNDLKYQGEDLYRSRLASLVHLCVKWYSILSILVFAFLMIVGYLYFTRYGDRQTNEVNWHIPWLLVCLGTGIKLFSSPFSSILSGLGFIKDISKITFYQQIILPAATWIGLFCGFKLYIIGFSYILSVLLWLVYIYKTNLYTVLVNIWQETITEKVDYFKEIFPYQWRIAISWVSGYFIFQLFNPVLFATEGAVVAGQMGMTLQALNAIQSFSMSWLTTKVPLYSKLIALKDYVQLDKIFNKTIIQMAGICAVLLIGMFSTIFILRQTQFGFRNTIFAERFLDYIPMLLMMIPLLANMFVFSWATYLRCHKKEPFLLQSVVVGVLCCISTLTLGKFYGLYGITCGYCLITLTISLPWALWLFKTNRRKWHGSAT